MHSGPGLGGVFAGMHFRGVGPGGPNMDNLTDENRLGRPYDNKVVTRLLPYLRPYKKDVLISITAVLGSTLANVFIPLFVIFGIKAINQGDTGRLHLIGIAFLALSLVHFGANYLQNVYLPKVGEGLLFSLRTHMFSHIQSLSLSFFHRTSVGRIMSRSQNDILQLQETFNLVIQSISEILSLVGIVIVMIIIEPRLALLTLSVIPALFLLLAYWQKFARRSFMRIRTAIAMVNGEYNQNITGVRVVEALNRQELNLNNFDKLNDEHLHANLQASRFSGGLQPAIELLIGLGMGFGVVYAGGIMVLGDDLDWGVLLAFALWIQRFFEPIRQLTMQYSELQRAMAAGMRIFEVLDLKPEVADAPDAPDIPSIKGEVRFEQVSFHYVPETEVLKNINLTVMPGESVAIVGPTGAGKSTLVSLILRFADVTKGQITLDGYDIRQVKRRSMVSQISMVLQEPYLFSGTVKENIRYCHEEASDEEVIAAAKAVGAHDFIMALEMGYDTRLAERGINLSVGQRQLISFARTIVANPRIIILDEATANIDTYTEVLIQKALKQVLQGRTSLVIAHRLSTIRNADRIIVLNHGLVVEQGNHQELLQNQGLYSHLYAMNYGADGVKQAGVSSNGAAPAVGEAMELPLPAPGERN